MIMDNTSIYIHNSYIIHMKNMIYGKEQYKSFYMIYIQNMNININMIKLYIGNYKK